MKKKPSLSGKKILSRSKEIDLSLDDENQATQLALFPHNESTQAPPQVEVQRTIESILAADQGSPNQNSRIEDHFYRTVDPQEEFGISRIVSDKIYYLPQLLTSSIKLIHQEGTTSYILKSSMPDSNNRGTITLEHRLQASDETEATIIGKQIVERLRGVLHKIWMAAWKLANEKRRFTFTCQLKELMNLCYPEREAFFQTHEKIEFYEHLRSLENTKILYTKNAKSDGKEERYHSIELRLLEIHHKSGKREEYPQELTITMLNVPSLQNEKMAFVGAAFKHKTLELRVDEVSLASWLQTRKSQLKDTIPTVTNVEENFLFKLASLEKTAKTNKSVARKRLFEKLERLIGKGVIAKASKSTNEKGHSNALWIIQF